MTVRVYDNRAEMGREAGLAVAERMRELLQTKDVSIVFASAPSQDEFLCELRVAPDIDWGRVTAFHLDEYVDLDPAAPQAFAQFLRDRLFHRIRPGKFHALDGMAKNLDGECRRYEELLRASPPDLACVGIGENGHLAFNDPPVADFNDPRGVKVVDLDPVSRRQQVNDGCFAKLEDVPTQALTLTLPAIFAARAIYCMVPGTRKAEAVHQALHGPIATACPASGLRRHPSVNLFLDVDSAHRLG